MFTDVANFTTIAEKLSTDELAQKLALYLEQMSRALSLHGATILERIGDALLVVWNAPTKDSHHQHKACLAALECLEVTAENPWRTRFGIHTAEVMVGHFGSEARMNYGILGDGVNLSARIESLNKFYGTRILVTGDVVPCCDRDLVFRKIDRVAVKGKANSVELFELLGSWGTIKEEEIELVRVYGEALELYFNCQFAEALEFWEKLTSDTSSQIMAARCRDYIIEPPTEDWGGVFRVDFK